MAVSRQALEAMKQRPSDVPCGDCRACCRHDRVILGPADDPRTYQWHVEGGYAVLDRRTNGECVYLTETGCGIHDRAPAICRRFDCRVLVLTTDEAVMQRRVSENPQMAEVYAAGRSRAGTLKP